MKKIILLLFLSIFIVSVRLIEVIPLSICGTASCVPNDNLNSVGACQINPRNWGYYPASLSQGAFSSGKRCGECFRLTGPNGTVNVMAYDSCTSEPCMQNDGFHFIVPREAFEILTRKGEVDPVANVYSLGYQEIACEFGTDTIQAVFNGGQNNGVADYQYYFTVRFSRYTVGIERVQLWCQGFSTYQDMNLNLGGLWTWNKKDIPGQDSKLTFPIKLVLTAFDGSHLSYDVTSKPKPSIPIDTQIQFFPVRHPNATDETCKMGMVPEFIFQDKIPYGWDTSNSWDITTINTTIDPGNEPMLNEHVIRVTCDDACALSFRREGGFQTQFIKSLHFVARADPPNSFMKVFFGKDSNVVSTTVAFTASWKNFTIEVNDMAVHTVEEFVTFQNTKAITGQALFFDNIRWEFKEGAPKTPDVVVDTTTSFPTMRPLTSGNTGTPTSGSGVSSTSGVTGQIPTSGHIPSTDGEIDESDASSKSISSSLSSNLILILLSSFIYTLLHF